MPSRRRLPIPSSQALSLALATDNEGKIREIRSLLSGLEGLVGLEGHEGPGGTNDPGDPIGPVRPVHRVGQARQTGVVIRPKSSFPGAPEVVEDGATFRENAFKKAAALAAYTGMPALADDSGLEVDHLCGLPGVRSARFAGPDAGDEANVALLLELLQGVPASRRGAQFACVICLVTPGGEVRWAEGICRGRIAEAPRGGGGFGYDPVFIVSELNNRTFAEVPPELKNRISHRSVAMRGIHPHLVELFRKEFSM